MSEHSQTPPETGRAWRRLPEALLWLLAGLTVFALGFMPLRTSHDEWWHLKTGKILVERGQLPETDVFSYTAADYAWDNHEWLSQVGMYLLWRWGEERVVGGWRLLILVKALLLAGTYLLLGLYLRRRLGCGARGGLVALLVLLLALGCGRFFFWPRPPVLTNFFMVLFLWLLWEYRAGRLRGHWLLLLALLMPLWANLHGGFLVGGVLLASEFVGAAGRWLWLRGQGGEEAVCEARRRALWLFGVGFLAALGTLLNPYGYKLYLLTGRVMASTELVGLIGEMAPPRLWMYWAFSAMLLLSAGAGLLALWDLRRRYADCRPAAAEWLVLVFFAWQALSHLRHLILFGLAAAGPVAWLLGRLWGRDRERPRRAWMRPVALGVCLAMMAWYVFLPGEGLHWLAGQRGGESTWDRNRKLLRGEAWAPGAYAEAAASFLLAVRPPGRLFNRNNLAGYLIWRLSPEAYRVFTDSRFDIFGGDFLNDEYSLADGWSEAEAARREDRCSWREVVEKWGIRTIFVLDSERVNWRLAAPDSGWALVFHDGAHAIWVERAEDTRELIERWERPAEARGIFERHQRRWAGEGGA